MKMADHSPPWSSMTVADIEVGSRRGDRSDLERIVTALFCVRWPLREQIASVRCDTDWHGYVIVLRDTYLSAGDAVPETILDAFDATLRSIANGHGGIVVLATTRSVGAAPLALAPAWWNDDPAT